MSEETLLTAAEVCRKLQICRRTLSRLTKRKSINYVRLGALIRFRPAAVELFVASREVRGKSGAGAAA